MKSSSLAPNFGKKPSGEKKKKKKRNNSEKNGDQSFTNLPSSPLINKNEKLDHVLSNSTTSNHSSSHSTKSLGKFQYLEESLKKYQLNSTFDMLKSRFLKLQITQNQAYSFLVKINQDIRDYESGSINDYRIINNHNLNSSPIKMVDISDEDEDDDENNLSNKQERKNQIKEESRDHFPVDNSLPLPSTTSELALDKQKEFEQILTSPIHDLLPLILTLCNHTSRYYQENKDLKYQLKYFTQMKEEALTEKDSKIKNLIDTMTQIQKNEEKNKDYYKENEILLNQKIKSLKSENDSIKIEINTLKEKVEEYSKENKILHNSLLRLPRESEKQWRDNLTNFKKKLSNEAAMKSSKSGDKNEDQMVKCYTSHPHDLWRIKELEMELKKVNEKLTYFQTKLKNQASLSKLSSPTLSSLNKAKSTSSLNKSEYKNHYEEEINRLKNIIIEKDENIQKLYHKLTLARAYPILSSDTSLVSLLHSNPNSQTNSLKKSSSNSIKSLSDRLNSNIINDDILIRDTVLSDEDESNENLTEEELKEIQQNKLQRVQETLELQNNFLIRQLELRRRREVRFHPQYDEDSPSNNQKLFDQTSKAKHISAIETAKKIFHNLEREYFEEFDDLPV